MKKKGDEGVIKRNLANALTIFRMLGALALALVKPFGIPFYIVYTLCGCSDGLDGPVARKFGTADEKGAFLDSVADIIFYAVMIYRLVPTLFGDLPMWVWIYAFCAFGLRIASYAVAGIRYHRFAALHTYGSKATSVSIFLLPYLLLIGRLKTFSWLTKPISCALVCTVAGLASLEELLIHIRQKTYDPSVHTIFVTFGKKN